MYLAAHSSTCLQPSPVPWIMAAWSAVKPVCVTFTRVPLGTGSSSHRIVVS